MPPHARRRPEKNEYKDYYETYVGKVPEGDILEILAQQRDSTLALLGSLPADRADYRYAPGKWTLRQVVRHIMDAEWLFTFRALSFARFDSEPLPGMDPDKVAAGAADSLASLPELLEEYRHLRTAGLGFFAGLAPARWDRGGVASGNPVTVRALAWIIAGHERHHLQVLREKYLAGATGNDSSGRDTPGRAG